MDHNAHSWAILEINQLKYDARKMLKQVEVKKHGGINPQNYILFCLHIAGLMQL